MVPAGTVTAGAPGGDDICDNIRIPCRHFSHNALPHASSSLIFTCARTEENGATARSIAAADRVEVGQEMTKKGCCTLARHFQGK